MKKIYQILMMTLVIITFGGLTTQANVSAHHKVRTKRLHKKTNHLRHHRHQKINQKKHAQQWHNGTPKIIRGTWYHDDTDQDAHAYIKYYQYRSEGGFLEHLMDQNNTFKISPGYGFLHIKYRHLGGHLYEIRGVQYQRDANNQVQDTHYYYHYKVNIYKHRLHFYQGHGIKDYTRKLTFKIVK